MTGLRVAGVGAGFFSEFHYAAWRAIDGVALAGVCDLNTQAASKQAGGAPVFQDIGEMLERVRPDILDIITPPDTHLRLIEIAYAAGVETVICQKPFCNDLGAATAATQLATQLGRRLVVHENFRFQPWWRTIRRELDQDRCGNLRQITFRLRPGDGQGPSAYLKRQPYFQTMPRLLIHETGVHWIDTFVYLMGWPNAVFADLRRLNPAIAGEDAGYFIFFYDDGRRALFDGNRLLDHAAANRRQTMGEALVEGDAATMSLDGDGRISVRAHNDDEWRLIEVDAPNTGFAGDCVQSLQMHVLKAITHGAPLENAAADYLNIIRIEEAIYQSAASGAKIPLPARPYAP